MPLPKIATPTYELELPSTGETIKYRPFLVKEEKVLVLALESEDTKQITNAIKAVIKNCIQSKGIKVEALPTFDIEYLFLNIRGKSVGENIEVNICKDKKFGDFSSNISMKSSHLYNQKPRDLAAEIIAGIEENKNISKIEIAGPGFINFFVTKNTKFEIIEKILNEKNNFGKNKIGKNLKVLIEFIYSQIKFI